MSEIRLNSYHIMWLFVMFDLPTLTAKDRKNHARFRKELEKDGFTMYQYSVYLRYCGSLESANVHIKRVKTFTPKSGHVSILTVTDRQYAGIINIWGEIKVKTDHTPMQLEFF
uniref:CRISPR-associated endoribonuclease Cas2 n=2 Tax=unclassified Prevotella TaxID=2638335 RepID=A0AB33JHC4_9BACT